MILGSDPARMPSRNWLPLEETTIAEAIRPLGYHTAFVGKWHLGHEPYFPIHNGFDVQFGVSAAGHPKSYFAPFFGEECPTYRDVPEGKYLTDQLTDDTLAYIDSLPSDKPFFLTLFYYSAHSPFQAPQELIDRLKRDNPGKNITPLTAMVSSIDTSIGRILDKLESREFAENTILCLLDDQGGLKITPPLRGTKRGGNSLYEGGARVPMIFSGKDIARPGSRTGQLASTVDILPTLLEMAGGRTTDYPGLDGTSLAGVLRGGPTTAKRTIFLYRSYESQYAAVRCENWKLIAYRTGRCELYDLTKDVAETNDLAEAMPEKVAELRDALTDFEKKMDVPGVLEK